MPRLLTASRFPGERFPVGSTVTFRTARSPRTTGTVTELREHYAIVAAGAAGRWRVPYTALTLIASGPRGGATLTEIEARAHGLLHTHELLSGLSPGWRFGFETTASRAAVCRHRDKTIAMALSYALRAPRHEIVDTLLHEIAHAIVGPNHKHDRVWKAKAREIGCTAERCTSLQHSVGGWLGRCTTCSRTWTRHRLTTKMRTRAICPRCRTRLTWQRNSDGTTASLR